MNKRLFWKLCLIIGTGVVAMFYLINLAVVQFENDMSMLAPEHRQQLKTWSQQAEQLYLTGSNTELEKWLDVLQREQHTWATIARADVTHIAGSLTRVDEYTGYNLGRNVDWQIHLYFKDNPIMELPFSDGMTSLLIELPDRMRPGSYWTLTRMTLQVLLPMLLLILLSYVLYQHIMRPLRELDAATDAFSKGRFDVRVKDQLGSRNDELAKLSETFDRMADHISELIFRQRQLIADLSHELRTPLTRLDIATENLLSASLGDKMQVDEGLKRIHRESQRIHELVDNTLTLSWLENESPDLRSESLDLTDLLQVIVDDAQFEYPDRTIELTLPDTAPIENSSHRALGQGIENILRNALRFTPSGQSVWVSLRNAGAWYEVTIRDTGPGVQAEHLEAIFRPFFRIEQSRPDNHRSFGLGLALAQRQFHAVAASVEARNHESTGLVMVVRVPKK